MEPRGYIAGGQYAAAPPVRSPESASTIWRLLAGTNDEDSTLQISVLTFCKTKGDRDMKKAFLALSLLIMAGCSSMQDLRNEPASNTFQSRKKIDAVSECILVGWQEESQKYGSVFIQPYDGGKTVFTQSQLEMVDLISEGGITKIEFRHQGGLFAYRINSRIKVIEHCI